MANPLGDYPLDWSNQVVQDVHRTLFNTVFIEKEIIALTQEAGLAAGEIDWNGNARLTWISAMNEAGRTKRMSALLATVQDRDSRLSLISSTVGRASPHHSRPRQRPPTSLGVTWDGFSDDSGTERQIVEGHETLLDIAFLEHGLERASRSAISRSRSATNGTSEPVSESPTI